MGPLKLRLLLGFFLLITGHSLMGQPGFFLILDSLSPGAATVTADHGYALLTNKPLATNHRLQIGKVSPVGDLLWLKQIHHTFASAQPGKTIQEGLDGNLYVNFTKYNKYVLLCADSLGNFNWAVQSEQRYNHNIPMPDSSILTFGYPGEEPGLARFSASGSPVWAYTFSSSSLNSTIYDAIAGYDGIYMCGRTLRPTPAGGQALLMKFDFDGNLLWSYEYGGSSYQERFLHLKQAQDSTLMVVMELQNGSLNQSAYTHLSKEGEVLSATIYQGLPWVNSAVFYDDYHIVFAGGSISTNFWMAEIDSSGTMYQKLWPTTYPRYHANVIRPYQNRFGIFAEQPVSVNGQTKYYTVLSSSATRGMYHCDTSDLQSFSQMPLSLLRDSMVFVRDTAPPFEAVGFEMSNLSVWDSILCGNCNMEARIAYEYLSGQTVRFTDSSSGGITNWEWDFGDGNTGSGSTVNHTYMSPGPFEVCLVVSSETCSDTVCTILEGVVGVQSGPSGQLLAYPNPADDVLQVKIPKNGFQEDLKMSLYDLTGRKMKVAMESDGTVLRILVHELPSGTYLLKIADQETASFQKIVLR